MIFQCIQQELIIIANRRWDKTIVIFENRTVFGRSGRRSSRQQIESNSSCLKSALKRPERMIYSMIRWSKRCIRWQWAIPRWSKGRCGTQSCVSTSSCRLRNIIDQTRQLPAFGLCVVNRTDGRSSHNPILRKTWKVLLYSIFSKGTLTQSTDLLRRGGARLRRPGPITAKPRTSLSTKLSQISLRPRHGRSVATVKFLSSIAAEFDAASNRQEHQFHFHVDGAHGVGYLVASEIRIEHAIGGDKCAR